MFVLSLWNPWPATFFEKIANPKRIENRSKPPPKAAIGQWIAYHAAKAFDHERAPLIAKHAPEISLNPMDHVSGVLCGLVFVQGFTTDVRLLPAEQRRWFLGPVAILTPEVIKFDEPIPCRGQQGWKHLSEEHEAIVRRYL